MTKKPNRYYLLLVSKDGNPLKNAYATRINEVRKIRKEWAKDSAMIDSWKGASVHQFQFKELYYVNHVDEKGNINIPTLKEIVASLHPGEGWDAPAVGMVGTEAPF